MARCKKCGKEMEEQREGFCSLSCYNLDLQERIDSMNNQDSIGKKANFKEFV